MKQVLFARVFMREQEAHLPRLLRKLQEEEKVRGVTVMRGIAGFGKSGRMHAAGLMELSLDLPLVIEFFDDAATVERVLDDLAREFPDAHLLSWPATLRHPS